MPSSNYTSPASPFPDQDVETRIIVQLVAMDEPKGNIKECVSTSNNIHQEYTENSSDYSPQIRTTININSTQAACARPVSLNTTPGDVSSANKNYQEPNNFAENSFNVHTYEDDFMKVIKIAQGTNILYALNWFLGFCSLTWATAVILGGMVTNIRKADYYSVAVLLILEALRLATTHYVSFFVTRYDLIQDRKHPKNLTYNEYRELAANEIRRSLVQLLQLFVLSVSIVLPSRRLRELHYYSQAKSCANQDSLVCNFNGIMTSLKIFYIVVLVSALIAVSGVIYPKIIIQATVDNPTLAMERYYQRIVWNCIVKGLMVSILDQLLLRTTDWNIVQFAFEIQALEYKHNTRASNAGHILYSDFKHNKHIFHVMHMYSDLMTYLYEHFKGFEAVKVELDSSDVFIREATARIVGCWIYLNIKGGKSLLLQHTLLSKLADAVDDEETGRAATSSFWQMAMKFPKQTAEVKNSQGKWLVDILIEKMHQVVEEGKHDKTIPFLRVLVKLIESENVGTQSIMRYSESGSSKLAMLKEDLIAIVRSCRYRWTWILAAHTFLKLLEINEVSEDADVRRNPLQLKERGQEVILAGLLKLTIKNIDQDPHWYQNQKHNSTVGTPNSNQNPAESNSTADASISFFSDLKHFILIPARKLICFASKHFILMPIRLFSYLLLIKLIWTLIPALISCYWTLILDTSVGKDPRPLGVRRPMEYVWKDEAGYLNQILQHILTDQSNDYINQVLQRIDPNNNENYLNQVIDQLKAELADNQSQFNREQAIVDRLSQVQDELIRALDELNRDAHNNIPVLEMLGRSLGLVIGIFDREKKNYFNPPNWLGDYKSTNYNVTVMMVFLTVGLCCFFIFYPDFHF